MTHRFQIAVLGAGPESLAHWASLYLYDVSPKCSPNTVEAKARDLDMFNAWFVQEARETRVRAWRASDTRAFLSALRGQRRAPTTLNRVLATLKHFARWVQDEHGVFAAAELPTRGIAALSEDEPPCRKLSDEQVQALIAAGRKRVADLLRGNCEANPSFDHRGQNAAPPAAHPDI